MDHFNLVTRAFSDFEKQITSSVRVKYGLSDIFGFYPEKETKVLVKGPSDDEIHKQIAFWCLQMAKTDQTSFFKKALSNFDMIVGLDLYAKPNDMVASPDLAEA